jgi:hypothetical protein
MTRPSGENGHDKRSRINLSHPLIVAMIPALILAAGTYFAGARTGHVLGLAPAPTATVTITATVTPSASHGGTSGTQPSSGQVLRRKNDIQLAKGYQLSFADSALRPFLASSNSGDLYVHGFTGYVGSSQQLAVIDGPAGFSQCNADTTYVALNGYANDNGQSLVHKTLCVTDTTGNPIAACYVTADTTQASVPAPALTMDCTVYALK